MKILFAIKGLHQAAGGAERIICDICTYLTEQRGHEVTLLTFDSPGTEPFYPLSSSVRLVSLGVGSIRAPTSILLLIKRGLALRQHVRKNRPDIAVAFMHSMFVPMAFALAGSAIPLIGSEHIVREHYRSRRMEFLAFVAAVPLMSRITVLSESIASEYPKWIRRKMVAVTNPVSPAFGMLPRSNIGSDPHRILSIGRFSRRKDHATLLAAFASIAGDFPEWTLRILGDGVLRPSLQKEVVRLGLEPRVSLPGIVKDIQEEFANSSFFALASKYESFGLVFAEAMACGRAAVAFADCQGASDVIDNDETGKLVAGADRVAALADGLRYMMENHEARTEMGARARKRVFRRFSIESVCRRWESIMDDVLLTTRRAPSGEGK